MYICVCKAVNDSTIRQAVRDGVTSIRELSARTGCGTQCGSCVKMARQVMHQALKDDVAPRSSVELQFAS